LVNPAAATTPSSIIAPLGAFSPPPLELASRTGAPRSIVPVANYVVCFSAICSIDKGSSSVGVIS
jgi:hypothetical protein